MMYRLRIKSWTNPDPNDGSIKVDEQIYDKPIIGLPSETDLEAALWALDLVWFYYPSSLQYELQVHEVNSFGEPSWVVLRVRRSYGQSVLPVHKTSVVLSPQYQGQGTAEPTEQVEGADHQILLLALAADRPDEKNLRIQVNLNSPGGDPGIFLDVRLLNN